MYFIELYKPNPIIVLHNYIMFTMPVKNCMFMFTTNDKI